MIKLGVSSACLYPMNIEDAVNTLGDNGIKEIELFINSNCEIKDPLFSHIKNTIDLHNMHVSSIHPYTSGFENMMCFSQYYRRFLDMLDYYKKYFEIMNILGAKVFVFHGGLDRKILNNDEYFKRYLKLVETGKEYGIKVCHENVARCIGGSLEFLCEMSTELGENALFVLDTKQAVRRGYVPSEFVKKLGNNIVHIHISDYNDEGDCQLVGTGNLNFLAFLQDLQKAQFTGSIILELYNNGYRNVGELYNNLTYMQNIIENVCGN